MSADLNTIQPLDAGLLAESETAAWANIAQGGRDYARYARGDVEIAHAAMEAERDALQARVKELERDLANARRNIQYLAAKPAERLARIADILGTPDDYGMMEPVLLNWKHALEEIASKLPSKQLQEQLLSSTAKANERLAKKLRWELSQIADDALAHAENAAGED